MKAKVAAIVLIVVGLLLVGVSVGLAAGGCKTSYRVKVDDTLNQIVEHGNVELLAFVKANGIYKDAPGNQRRTIYVGQNFCFDSLPGWNGKTPTWASWPAADVRGYLVGKNLVIQGWNFNYPTSWFVKITGQPKVNMKVKYRVFDFSLSLSKQFEKNSKLNFCIKNLTTDTNICRTAYRLR